MDNNLIPEDTLKSPSALHLTRTDQHGFHNKTLGNVCFNCDKISELPGCYIFKDISNSFKDTAMRIGDRSGFMKIKSEEAQSNNFNKGQDV